MLDKKYDHRGSAGFALVEAILVVAIIAAIVIVGVYVAGRHNKQPVSDTTMAASGVQAKPGTSASIDQLIAQEESSESADSGSYANAVSQTTTSDNASLASLGGAYNESNL